jgi:hypothetical protein
MPGSAVFERRLGALPLATYEAGETVLAAGSRIDKTIEKIEGLLGSNGASLVYAGYPYDPYA